MFYKEERKFGTYIVDSNGTIVMIFPKFFNKENMEKYETLPTGIQNLLIAIEEEPELDRIISRFIGGAFGMKKVIKKV